MSITTHETNDGEELINFKYFSFHFNFPREKEGKKRTSGMSVKELRTSL
jgi:hypothetical protein